MEADSILISTKNLLGIEASYIAFDLAVVTFINTAFSILEDLGLGSFLVEDETLKWSDLDLTEHQLKLLKSYVFLKARLLFDPPSLSFVLDAMNKEIEQYEWRLSSSREEVAHPLVVDPVTNIGRVYTLPSTPFEEEPV